jgi:transcriptional regulator with XRE-family HTH domain
MELEMIINTRENFLKEAENRLAEIKDIKIDELAKELGVDRETYLKYLTINMATHIKMEAIMQYANELDVRLKLLEDKFYGE